MRRRVAIIISIILAAAPCATAGQPQKLEKIVVTASRLPSEIGSAERSVTVLDPGYLEYREYDAIPDTIGELGGIDVRRRGVEGVQSDISIRGTTFEQNAVLVDGIPVGDPQTGHFSTDLPFTQMDLDRVEIVKGPASSLYGPNAFGGAVNVITKRPEGEYAAVAAEGGSFDYSDLAASVTVSPGPLSNRLSVEQRRSTGYMPETDFNIFTVSDSAILATPFGAVDFLFGYMYKEFGAATFYSNLYPNEREGTDTRFFRLGGDIEQGSLTIRPKLFLRRHKDKFALDANRPGWQTNYHTTYDYGAQLDLIYENKFMDVAYGYELARDTIDSTNIQTHSRTRDAFYVELSPHIIEGLGLKAGLREDYCTGIGWQGSPSVSAAYELFPGLTVRGLVGRAFRIPTFTDLYYNDAANAGNASLIPESTWSYEAGSDAVVGTWKFSGTFFHRDGYDTIDWIRYSSKAKWQASNIGSTGTNGCEASVSVTVDRSLGDAALRKLFVDYTAVDTYAKHDYLSKYALDYLKQQLCAGAEGEYLGFRNTWVVNYKKRIGDSGYIVVDTKVSRDIVRAGKVTVNAFFEISNLFDVSYSEQSGVEMPGRWIRSGGRITF